MTKSVRMGDPGSDFRASGMQLMTTTETGIRAFFDAANIIHFLHLSTHQSTQPSVATMHREDLSKNTGLHTI